MSRSDVLVDADWVQAHLGDPSVVLVEVDEDTTAYDKGHIANAVKIDWRKDLQRRPRDPLRGEQQLVRRLRVLVLPAVRAQQRQAARRWAQEVGTRLPRP